MIKAVIFDLDGTIISDDYIQDGLLFLYKKNKNQLGNLDFNTFLDANRKSVNVLRKLHSEKKVYLHQVGITIWYLTLKYLKIPTQSRLIYSLYSDLQTYILDSIRIKPGFLDLIKYLKNKQIMTGVLSNGLFIERYERIKRIGILNFIDVLISSDIVGVEKPDKKIFNYILKVMKILPEESIYIGNDLIEDIKGARAVGILPILMLNKNHKDDKLPRNIIVIEDFRDIINIINKSNI